MNRCLWKDKPLGSAWLARACVGHSLRPAHRSAAYSTKTSLPLQQSCLAAANVTTATAAHEVPRLSLKSSLTGHCVRQSSTPVKSLLRRGGGGGHHYSGVNEPGGFLFNEPVWKCIARVDCTRPPELTASHRSILWWWLFCFAIWTLPLAV
jgi:hypothetical protein